MKSVGTHIKFNMCGLLHMNITIIRLLKQLSYEAEPKRIARDTFTVWQCLGMFSTVTQQDHSVAWLGSN